MTTINDLKVGKKLVTKWSFTDSDNQVVNVELVNIITLVTEKRVTMVSEKGSNRRSTTGRNLSTEWQGVKSLLQNINSGKTTLED